MSDVNNLPTSDFGLRAEVERTSRGPEQARLLAGTLGVGREPTRPQLRSGTLLKPVHLRPPSPTAVELLPEQWAQGQREAAAAGEDVTTGRASISVRLNCLGWQCDLARFPD
jgi:hypothetical protein